MTTYTEEKMITENAIITAVGLGPGDPELITLKGLKALQSADYIFFPASKVSDESVTSFSQNIIKEYSLTAECKPILIPMTGKDISEYYLRAYETLVAHSEGGKKVVIVNQGDITFYSTYGYIQEIANAKNVKCELIPGIPAFILAGSKMEEPLIDGNNSIKVMARPSSFEDINKQNETCEVLVVMKMKVIKGWYEFLSAREGSFFYAEKIGTTEEFTTKNVEDLKGRLIPYFATIILKK